MERRVPGTFGQGMAFNGVIPGIHPGHRDFTIRWGFPEEIRKSVKLHRIEGERLWS